MTVHIIGAGEYVGLPTVQPGDFVVAADGGYAACGDIVPDVVIGDFDSLGRIPDPNGTDFSSSAPSHKKTCVVKLPREKDETDTFAAVKWVLANNKGGFHTRLSPFTRRAVRVVDSLRPAVRQTKFALRAGLRCRFLGRSGSGAFVFWNCTGGRLDHTLANLQLLAWLAARGLQGFLVDRAMVFTAVRNTTLTFPPGMTGTLSVFAHTNTAVVSINGGVRYPLTGKTIDNTFALGVSNHLIGEGAALTVTAGTVIVGFPRDGFLSGATANKP